VVEVDDEDVVLVLLVDVEDVVLVLLVDGEVGYVEVGDM